MATVTKAFSNVQLTSSYYAYTWPDGSHAVSTPTTDQSTTVSFTSASMGIPAGASISSAKFTFGLTSSAHGTLIRELNFNGTATSPVNSGASVTMKSSNSVYFRFKSGTSNTSYPAVPPAGEPKTTKTNSSTINLTDIVLTVIYTLPYTACTPPTTLSFPSAFANPGSTARLSWSGAGAGTGNPIAGYEVYRATSPGGTYSKLTGGETASTYFDVPSPSMQGTIHYFKVKTIGTAEGYDSELSAYAALKANTRPPAPTVTGNGCTTYNSRPRLLVTVGTDADGHTQAISLSGYTASTTGQLAAGKKIVLRRTAVISAPGAEAVTVTATDQEGGVSLPNSLTLTYAATSFADPTLIAGSSPIKAAHVNELRAAVNNLRLFYGLTSKSWVEAITAGSTSLGGWKAHVLELRDAIDDVVTLVNGWDTSSTTHNIPAISWISIPTNSPSMAVMDQLRAVIPTL